MKLPVEWKVIGKEKTIEKKGKKKVQQMEKNRKKEKLILIVLHWQKDAANVINALIH